MRLVFIFSGTLVYLYILLSMNILKYYYTEKPMRLIKWVPATPATRGTLITPTFLMW